MSYIQPADLLGAATQYLSAVDVPRGVDWTLYTVTQLQNLCDEATRKIDGWCRQTFALTNVQERYNGNGTNTLRMRHWPLAQIQDSVAFGSGTTGSLVADTALLSPVTGNASPLWSGQWLSGGTSGVAGVQSNALLSSTTGTLTVGDTLLLDAPGSAGAEQVTVTAVSGTGPYTATFTTALAHTLPLAVSTASQVVVADCANILPGQFLAWADGTSEGGLDIAAVTPLIAGATSGQATLTLRSPLQVSHGAGARCVVNTIDMISLVLPGQSFVPIPIQQLIVNGAQGTVVNYTPLMFQQLGYATIFPKNLPILVRYTYGYLSGTIQSAAPALFEAALELCVRTIQRRAHAGMQGKRSEKMGERSQAWGEWLPVAMDADLVELLRPYRRGVGIH